MKDDDLNSINTDIKNLLNSLVNKIELDELDRPQWNQKQLESIQTTINFDDSLIELDEYFRFIDESDNSDLETSLITNLKCDACNSKSSLFWRRVAREKLVCNSCYFEKAYLILFDDEHLNKKIKINSTDTSSNNKNQNGNKKKNQNSSKSKKLQSDTTTTTTRPVTRTSVSLKTQLSSSSNSTCSTSTEDVNIRKSARISKSKISKDVNELVEEPESCNRRTKLFKKETPCPIKREILVSKISNSDYVFHRGFYMQVGDIVALRDKCDMENIYFAQIRAILSDQFAQKSAVLTWLIPVNDKHKTIKTLKDFEPSMFELGPAEEFPRSLDCMEFVCRLDNTNVCSKSTADIDYYDIENQFKTDLLKHKYNLEDLAESNFKLITKKYYKNKSELCEYEIKFDY